MKVYVLCVLFLVARVLTIDPDPPNIQSEPSNSIVVVSSDGTPAIVTETSNTSPEIMAVTSSEIMAVTSSGSLPENPIEVTTSSSGQMGSTPPVEVVTLSSASAPQLSALTGIFISIIFQNHK